jgi:hypothetical protein
MWCANECLVNESRSISIDNYLALILIVLAHQHTHTYSNSGTTRACVKQNKKEIVPSSEIDLLLLY